VNSSRKFEAFSYSCMNIRPQIWPSRPSFYLHSRRNGEETITYQPELMEKLRGYSDAEFVQKNAILVAHFGKRLPKVQQAAIRKQTGEIQKLSGSDAENWPKLFGRFVNVNKAMSGFMERAENCTAPESDLMRCLGLSASERRTAVNKKLKQGEQK